MLARESADEAREAAAVNNACVAAFESNTEPAAREREPSANSSIPPWSSNEFAAKDEEPFAT